jgi:hypothetical protein
MVVDVIFDSLCRCFGAPGSQTPQPGQDDQIHNIASTGRRSDLVQLKDKQFDTLFVDNAKSSKNTTTKQQQQQQNNNSDVEQARAVAKVKLASSAKRHKRKSPATRRDEIFRTRGFEQREKPEPTPNSFSRFLSSQNVANALCFATPVHEEGEANEILKTESDCATLNTCEDTVTSTLFFERKYAHIVEHRPPMPLFNQFKVSTHESNELRNIVASDSHNSLKMIRLMDDAAQDSVGEVFLEEESEEEDVVSSDDDVPPVVKIDSSHSSASSRR